MMDRANQTGKSLGRWALVPVMAVFVAACSPMMEYHGYAPTDTDLAEVTIGQDTRETVAQKVGQPGMGGVMEGSGWFYVQSDWRRRGWRAPEETDRQVVAISFDLRDRVSNIERFGLEDGEVISLSRRVTDSGPRPGVLSQVFRVLGQFSAASLGG
ncbi:outer membrane protein assembly factor BamE [Pararhodobacter zhoushanensis]|uniref:Outer membrane protein assembly factor BamE n=1 Tax=Pararhodobacter zhoushanensis TaxID=2479545 RepID=A0ABT3H0C5_9RHOB|nr:outer membrane protein assembly factor BamE [Pararhodobacter zhoushanensis]MCW1933249.1 outer membrane protein assembly factor BamE [Pararhodobacter zhoushanensis]